jgi:hypothetical protein
MRSSLLASVDVTEFQTTEAYSSLDLTKVRYSVYKHSRDNNNNNNNNDDDNNADNTNINTVTISDNSSSLEENKKALSCWDKLP